MPYKIVTLVYATRNKQVLLLCRTKAPFIGYWVAPGGKVDAGESPQEGALRELLEETGLRARRAQLRAVVTETSGRSDWQWLIFVYRVDEPVGDVVSDEREGKLRWFDIGDELWQAKMPEADRIFVPNVLGEDESVVEYRFDYDEALNLLLREGSPSFRSWL